MQQVAYEGNTAQFGAASFEPASMEVAGLPERPDGNNVNIDRESLLLSQTQLQYQMGVQLIKSQFHTLLTAIKEGS
jgi:flagellar basal-body rod protein FlgB